MSDLIFVYALESGLFNEISGYAHKIFSPKTYPCSLCGLTNGPLGAKKEWTQFIRELGVKAEFLHYDTFAKRYPNAKHDWPAAFRSAGDGKAEVLITSAEINNCADLGSLISLVRERTK